MISSAIFQVCFIAREHPTDLIKFYLVMSTVGGSLDLGHAGHVTLLVSHQTTHPDLAVAAWRSKPQKVSISSVAGTRQSLREYVVPEYLLYLDDREKHEVRGLIGFHNSMLETRTWVSPLNVRNSPDAP